MPPNLDIMITCSPVTLGTVSSEGIFGRALPGRDLTTVWLLNTGYNLALALIVALFTSVALRRTMMREASSDGGAAPKPARVKKAATTSAAPAPVPERIAERERTVSDRPVLWREVRQATFGSRRRFLVVLGLTASILAFLYFRVGFDEGALHAVIAVIGAIAVMAQAVFLTAGSIGGEREAKTWDVLVCTPLTGREIVLGKFAGALRIQWFLPIVALAHIALAAMLGYVAPIFLVHIAIIYAGPVFFFSATGTLMSLSFRKTTVAAACNLALALLLWAGTWIAAGLSAWFFDFSFEDWFDYVWAVCYAANPVAMVASAIEPAVGVSHWRGNAMYEIAGLRVDTMEFTLVTLAAFGAFVAGAAAALWIAIGRFSRLSGRSS